jgi:HPt (histidine-containing phosphotransfer) domain-containing protein
VSIDPYALTPYREAMGAEADAFVIDLIETFLATSQELVDALYTSLAAADSQTFTRCAHTLKSNSAIFGAYPLSDLCKELEIAGKSGSMAGLLPKINLLKAEYNQVCRELASLRQSLVG